MLPTMRLPALILVAACCASFVALLPGSGTGQEDPKKAKAEAVERDRIALQGGWKLVAVEEKGKPRAKKEFEDGRYVFLREKILEMTGDNLNFEIDYEIDPTSKPKRINEYFKVRSKDGKQSETMIRGIYELDGDTLVICTSAGERPAAFDSTDGVLMELQREKKRESPADDLVPPPPDSPK
jgi:uncharacterized protein (TIGR03067 family)